MLRLKITKCSHYSFIHHPPKEYSFHNLNMKKLQNKTAYNQIYLFVEHLVLWKLFSYILLFKLQFSVRIPIFYYLSWSWFATFSYLKCKFFIHLRKYVIHELKCIWTYSKKEKTCSVHTLWNSFQKYHNIIIKLHLLARLNEISK